MIQGPVNARRCGRGRVRRFRSLTALFRIAHDTRKKWSPDLLTEQHFVGAGHGTLALRATPDRRQRRVRLAAKSSVCRQHVSEHGFRCPARLSRGSPSKRNSGPSESLRCLAYADAVICHAADVITVVTDVEISSPSSAFSILPLAVNRQSKSDLAGSHFTLHLLMSAELITLICLSVWL